MTHAAKTDSDLVISRIIKAPRVAIWNAWTDPRKFEQWWIPEPLKCKVDELDVRAGGYFVTRMSENGSAFTPHMNACFLAIDDMQRIVFTNALVGGWRPAEETYPMAFTAIITFQDHPLGTEYGAHGMHKNDVDRETHKNMGFYDGWGTVLEQLARLTEIAA